MSEGARAGREARVGPVLAALLALYGCELDVTSVPSYADGGACRDECETGQAMCADDATERTCEVGRKGCRVWRNAPCADANACTLDGCDGATGRCTHMPDDALCGAGGACSFAYCDAIAGCRTMALRGTCDDGNDCTEDDRCEEGACVGRPFPARLECTDACPDDPAKTAPGLCGCGVAEALGDGDRDGVRDCADACPIERCKTELSCSEGKLASCHSDERGCPRSESCDGRFRCALAAPCPSLAFTRYTESGLAFGTVAVASNGDVFTGWTTDTGASAAEDPNAGDALITRFDPNGTRRNSFLFDSSLRDEFVAIDVGPGDTTLAGALQIGGTPTVVAWPATGGVELWVSSPPLDGRANLVDVAYGPDGDVYALGSVQGTLRNQVSPGERDVFLARFAAESGFLLWARQFGSAGADQAIALATDGAAVYVAGVLDTDTQAMAGEPQAFVRSYDAKGGLRWHRNLGSEGKPATVVRSLTFAAIGDVLVSAASDQAASRAWLFQLSPDNEARGDALSIDAGALLGDHASDLYALARTAPEIVSLAANGALRWTLDGALTPSSRLLDATIWRPSGAAARIFAVGAVPGQSGSAYLMAIALP